MLNFLKSDLVCRKSQDILDFGRIQDVYKYDAETERVEKVVGDNTTRKEDRKNSQENGLIQLEILWEKEKLNSTGKYTHPTMDYVDPREGDIVVAERKLQISQRVRNTQTQALGTITHVEKLVTLKLVGAESVLIIPDVKLSSIRPLTPLFYGVMIEYSGWIGQVAKVTRRALWSYPCGGPIFHTMSSDPPSWVNGEYAEAGDHIGRGYPYLLRTNDPYPGKKRKFGPVELMRVGIGVGREWVEGLRDERKCREWSEGEAEVLGVEVTSVSVVWLGRIQSHLYSRSKIPPGALLNDSVQRINPLYINPSLYLDKNGIAFYSGVETDRILPGFLWGDEFFSAQISDTIYENPKAGDELLVHKVFTRNLYTVKWDLWDETVTTQHYGHELQPEIDPEHSKRSIFSSYFFCKRVGECSGDEYGVVVERVPYDTTTVQWLKILPNGTVSPLTLEEGTPLTAIKKHPVFGDLGENRIVVKSKLALDLGFAYGFSVGTVVSIDRWGLGEVTVYCSSEKKLKRMLPHEIELFQQMTADQMVRLKLIGRGRK